MPPRKPSAGQTELTFLKPPAAAPVVPTDAPPPEAPVASTGPERMVFGVGELVRAANRWVEGRFANVWVEGEVVGLKRGGAGHAFFSLKDETAVLATCMWRSSVERLRFGLENGQMLRVWGRLGIFVKTGKFQLYAERAEPAGLGALLLEIEQRKQRLAAEGLFDRARKRPLPRWPRRIGVVTSAHGAAIHDIVEVARRRCPSKIVLAPAVVQGPEAPRSLRQALRRLAALPDVDVVILGRGGGSIEDLWAFHDEALARAIAAFEVPVVSAVGHETDVTICDLVADVRAATPSQAAEIVVPDRAAELARLDGLQRRMARVIERAVLDERAQLEQVRGQLARCGRSLVTAPRQRLRAQARKLEHHHPRQRISRDRKRLEALLVRLRRKGASLPTRVRASFEQASIRLVRAMEAMPRRRRTELDRVHAELRRIGASLPEASRLRLTRSVASLQALSPLRVLARGYAVVTDAQGHALTRAADVAEGDELGVRLHEGRVRARVVDTRTEEDET